MENLNHDQAIDLLNNLLGENVKEKFEEQVKTAGEHGNPSFVIGNSKGETAEVLVDWDKEADILSYSINEDFQGE